MSIALIIGGLLLARSVPAWLYRKEQRAAFGAQVLSVMGYATCLAGIILAVIK